MAEQRIYPRADVKLEVQYQPVPEYLTASSMNISSGGIYICTPQPQPRDREILLRFRLPGVAHPFQLSGLVVWSNPGTGRSPHPAGMGIKFLNVTETDAKLIADFVATAQGQGSPPASAQAPAPPVPVSVDADALGIVVLADQAKPAQAASPPPAAKPPGPSPPAVLPQEPPVRSTSPPPASEPEPEIPAHIQRQLEYMMSLQAPPAPGLVSPPAPAEKPVEPSPSGQPPRTAQPGQPGQSSRKTRPPQKPGEKKK